MVDVGDDAPDFTVPVARDDIESFSLSTHLDEAPLVLAFFPAAFTPTCTTEMDAFQERLDRFTEAGAAVYGVSTDSPFALSAFRADRGLDFGLLSDYDRDLIDAYDLRTDFDAYGIHGLAARAVVVVGTDGRVAYRWVADDPGREPDYDEVLAAVSD